MVLTAATALGLIFVAAAVMVSTHNLRVERREQREALVAMLKRQESLEIAQRGLRTTVEKVERDSAYMKIAAEAAIYRAQKAEETAHANRQVVVVASTEEGDGPRRPVEAVEDGPKEGT